MSHRLIKSNGTAVVLEEVGLIENAITLTEGVNLRVEDSGNTYLIGTNSLTAVLADPATVGLEYSFMNIGDDGVIQLNIDTPSGGIIGTIANSAADSVAASWTTIENTLATAKKGDRITLISDGVNYLVKAGVGIWAEG